MFWIDPIWLGTAASAGGAVRILDTVKLMEPMFTTVQRVLSNELPSDISIWPELILADVGEGEKNVVVRNDGAEDISTTGSRQQTKRYITVQCVATDANEAETLMQQVRTIMKKSELIPLSTMMELPGDYNEQGQFFTRQIQFTLRTRL